MSGRFHAIHRGLRWALGVPYLSGLHEISRIFAPTDLSADPPQLCTQFYPARQVLPAGRARQWYRYNLQDPGWAWPITPTDKETLREDPYNKFVVEWVRPTLPELDGAGLGLKSFPRWPGLYTGKMRMVAQKRLGRKKPVPFHYNCGIWTPTGDGADRDKQRWVVEIDQLNGVFAYPVAFRRESCGHFDELSPAEQDRWDFCLLDSFELPTLETDSFALAFARDEDGRRYKVRIAQASALHPCYNDSFGAKGTLTPWYWNWAFSYSGREAQIVTVGAKEHAGHSYCYTTRYKLSFAQTSVDIGGKSYQVPGSVAVSLQDEGFLVTGEFDLQLFAPIDDPYQEQLYFPGPDGVTPPEPRDAPVYVFYDRKDDEIVLRRADSGAIAADEVEQIGIACTTPGCVVPCVYCDHFQPCPTPDCVKFSATAELCMQGMIETRHDWIVETAGYYCDRSFPAGTTATGRVNGQYRWLAPGGDLRPANNAVCNLLNYDYVVVTEFRYGTGYQRFDADHGENRTVNTKIVLPLYDREGFFHFRDEIRQYNESFRREEQVAETRRVAKMKGPYAGMPEISVFAPYTIPGFYYPSSVVTEQPEPEHDVRFAYVGSVADNDDANAENGVVTLDPPAYDTPFADGMVATAIVEAFGGGYLLFPYPVAAESGAAARYSSMGYPLDELFRLDNGIHPQYLCFVGDGIETEKPGFTDINLIGHLRRA